jgi:four helix bundle protein
MQNFRQLSVWQKSHKLTLFIYNVTRTFPKDERFGLTSQLRRASSSIAANIAEGCGRSTRIEFRRFLDLAMGSASEVEYFLLLACDLGLITAVSYGPAEKNIIEIKRMLAGFIETLRRASAKN